MKFLSFKRSNKTSPFVVHNLVMEDLRVLEQQQRDSQRLLASTKLTKQHKLEQRLSLETKLSTLKYSNGEARAQLQRARDVLSKSTRELGSAKVQSERSSDNLKRFDNKLRKTLGHVRGLHSKRRQVEQAIGKLRNANTVLSQREKTIMDQIKSKEMERDDVKHREKLLIKSIQTSKRKVQEFVEGAIQMRSELSELQSDLTLAQQMEASTKYRVDVLKTESTTEQRRHEESKGVVLLRIKDLNVEKMEIEKKIIDKSKDIDVKMNALTEAFEHCVRVQKEDGFKLSTSPTTAALDMDGIRNLIEVDESNLRVVQEEESTLIQKTKTIEDQIKKLQSTNEQIDEEANQVQQNLVQMQNDEDTRKKAHESFMAEFQKEQEEVEELRKSVARLREDQDTSKTQSIQSETEQKSLLDEVRVKVENAESELLNLNETLDAKKAEFENISSSNKQTIDQGNKGATAKSLEFDSVQKLADDLKATHFDTKEEISSIEANGRDEMNDLSNERVKLFDGKFLKALVEICSWS